MTSTSATPRTRRLPLIIGVAVVALGLVAAAVLGGESSGGGPALSPSSTDPSGTKALVLLLQSFGTDVNVAQEVTPAQPRSVALVLRDDFSDDERAQLRQWVADGGTLVVADPTSALVTQNQQPVFADELTQGGCTLTEVGDAHGIRVRSLTLGLPAVQYARGNGERSCFGDASSAYVVQRTLGRGSIIAVGGQGPFVNDLLADQDNSVLAMRLLAPVPGQGTTIFDPNRAGHGRTGLLDLVAPRVIQFMIELAIAVVVYVLFRMRRLGKPVVEPQPVQIAGSGLVQAIGSLHHRSAGYDRARTILQDDTRRRLAERYGLPAQAPATVVAQSVAGDTHFDRDTVYAALTQPFTGDDDALLALAHQLDDIREEVLDGRG